MADTVDTVKVDVVDAGGMPRGTLELSGAVFGGPVHGALLHQAVVREQAGRHRGTHDTRGRSEVSGGGRKPWRQKGTGRARQGSIRATQWKGGGKPFGPTPRSYAQAMPREARQGALRAAWAAKVAAGRLTVVDDLRLTAGKTKAVVELLGRLGVAGTPTLLVLAAPAPELVRACRNVPWLTLGRPGHVSVADLLRHDRVVADRAALTAIQEALGA